MAGNVGVPTGVSAKRKHLLQESKGPVAIGVGMGHQDCWLCMCVQMQRKLKGNVGLRSNIRAFECLQEVAILSFFQVGAA